MKTQKRDHGGGIDSAIAQYAGDRASWIDLSTGINPHPYPIGPLATDLWTSLPDEAAHKAIKHAARRFWRVPDAASILPAPGASSVIATLPGVLTGNCVSIPTPTYNEHAASFAQHGWHSPLNEATDAMVVVHPNNPDGKLWTPKSLPSTNETQAVIIDESFCDVAPDQSLIAQSASSGRIVLKSFGKFWGLAGLRLGFAIGDPALISALAEKLGPWPVSGPALSIGLDALKNTGWAEQTRIRLQKNSDQLDDLMTQAGADLVGGTTLFRLYHVDDALAWQNRLAEHHIWTRCFPYNRNWLRLGLPHHLHWPRLTAALR